MRRLFVCSAMLCAICAGCNSPSPRLNAPPHGVPEATSDMQGTYVYMVDNALLSDMCISDVHFVPHRAMLNTLGEQRLSRLASLMEVYGGEVRFSTNLEDDDLIGRRTETILEFLAEAGVDTTADTVRRDLPGGEGMAAREVILIKTHEAEYQPGQPGGSGSPSGGPWNQTGKSQ